MIGLLLLYGALLARLIVIALRAKSALCRTPRRLDSPPTQFGNYGDSRTALFNAHVCLGPAFAFSRGVGADREWDPALCVGAPRTVPTAADDVISTSRP